MVGTERSCDDRLASARVGSRAREGSRNPRGPWTALVRRSCASPAPRSVHPPWAGPYHTGRPVLWGGWGSRHCVSKASLPPGQGRRKWPRHSKIVGVDTTVGMLERMAQVTSWRQAPPHGPSWRAASRTHCPRRDPAPRGDGTPKCPRPAEEAALDPGLPTLHPDFWEDRQVLAEDPQARARQSPGHQSRWRLPARAGDSDRDGGGGNSTSRYLNKA